MKASFSILVILVLILLFVSPILTQDFDNSETLRKLEELQARLSQYQPIKNQSNKLADLEDARLDMMGKKIEFHHMKVNKQLSFIRNQKKYLQERLSPLLEKNIVTDVH
jgi:hypothetical protein